jgi:hypothetical protein
VAGEEALCSAPHGLVEASQDLADQHGHLELPEDRDLGSRANCLDRLGGRGLLGPIALELPRLAG